MNVQAHTTTMRERARVFSPAPVQTEPSQPDGHAPEAIEAQATKTESISIESVSFPTEYTPGETLFPEIQVVSTNGVVSPFDPDYCIHNTLVNGYRVRILIFANDFKVGEIKRCQMSGRTQPTAHTFDNGISMPTSGGPVTLEAVVKMANTGTEVASVSRTVMERETADSGGDTSGGDTSGGDTSGGDTSGGTNCPQGQVYDTVSRTCIPADPNDPNDPNNTTQCAGLLAALLKPECSLDTYLQNAQSGAMAMGAVFLILMLVLMAGGR